MLINISEWRVKVRGNHSSMRVSEVRSPRALEDAWGKKLRVAPDSSDLSPHWSNIYEGYWLVRRRSASFVKLHSPALYMGNWRN